MQNENSGYDDEIHEDNNNSRKNKKRKGRYRIDIILIVCFFVLLVSFCAYMMNTSLDTVLSNEAGSSIVTHDYT